MSKEFSLPARGNWAHLPTPIQKLERLSTELGIELFVKRDDQTGFEWSGNKIRKLNFLVQEAMQKGATCLITCGGLQSNHCRATAALAAHLGLRCILLLRGEKPKEFTSNLLLDHLFGAEIFYVTDEQYANQKELLATIDSQVRQIGGKTYYIPEGGSNSLGTMGYVHAWQEINQQIQAGDASLASGFDSIVVAHGSGGTQAGLILGKILLASASLPARRVIGVNVCYDKAKSFEIVKDILWNTIQGYRLPLSFLAEDIEILDGFVGRGYALNTPEELAFIAKVARVEGLLLDPTYSGKAMYALFQTVKKQKEALGKRVLFLHTGGGFGNFKSQNDWMQVWK